MTARQHRLTSEDVKKTLAEMIAADQVTCSVEEAGDIWGIGRCTAYEIAETTFGAIRVGRKLRVSIPHLMKMLDLPLPEKWMPTGTLAGRLHDDDAGSDSAELGTDHHVDDAGRADVVAFDQRRHKGSGPDRAQASPDRGRGGGRGSRSG